MAQRTSVVAFLREELQPRSLALYALVFLSLFLTAKFGQYLFYDQNTSPAVLWPPFGIAFAAILLGGYRMWLPVALAELLATFSAGISPLPLMVAATLGQTIQPLVGAWMMRSFDFDLRLSRIRDAFVLIGVTFITAMIAPTISTLTQIATHTLTATFEVAWTRSWAGGIFSILILTPLLCVWFPLRKNTKSAAQLAEATLALLILVGILLFSSWTPYGANAGLIVVYIYLGVMTWISIRMEPRILTLALFLTVVFSMGGEFYLAQATPLNQRLFSQELFIEFLAIIFLAFSALVEERRQARAALEESVGQLQSALKRIENEDAAKNQFIATLAHELRNPLAPVVSALDFLSLQEHSRETQETIEGAQRELSVMRRLLDDILDVARVSQIRFKLQKEVIDIRPILERSIQSTSIFLRNRKHTLTITLPGESVMLEVDPIRFQQIFVNLLNNAGKYTPQGGTIELVCEKIGGYAVIRVSDNGIGIPQEFLKEIFEPFRQIRPTPQLGTGLGIGLWLTKRLVEAHDGAIEAVSEGPERGSSFILRFPLKHVPGSGVATAKTSSVAVSPLKILIVDDNEAAASAMQKLLAYKGHETRAVHDGASAISAVGEYAPRVVLLDVGLPDMSGYDVAKEIRSKDKNLILIAVTGYGQDEDKEMAKGAGFRFHLTKPVGIADIETVLAQLAL